MLRPGMRLWWRLNVVVLRQMCEAPAAFQNRVSFADLLAAGAHRHPHLNPDRARLTVCLLPRSRVAIAENVERALVGPISVRHPAVAPFGDARQGQGALMTHAVPHRHFRRGRGFIPASSIVPLPADAYMRRRCATSGAYPSNSRGSLVGRQWGQAV